MAAPIPQELSPNAQQRALRKFKVKNYPKFENQTRDNINTYAAASNYTISADIENKIKALEQYLTDNMQTTAPGEIADEVSKRTAEMKAAIQIEHLKKTSEIEQRIAALKTEIKPSKIRKKLEEKRDANDKKLQQELESLQTQKDIYKIHLEKKPVPASMARTLEVDVENIKSVEANIAALKDKQLPITDDQISEKKEELQAELDTLNADLKKQTDAFATLEKSFATDLGKAHQATANNQAWINGIASLRASEDYRKILDNQLGITSPTGLKLGSGPSELEITKNIRIESYINPMGGETKLNWDKDGKLIDFEISAESPLSSPVKTSAKATAFMNEIDRGIDSIPVINVLSYMLKIPCSILGIAAAETGISGNMGAAFEGFASIIDAFRGVADYQRACFKHEACALTGVMLRQGKEDFTFTVTAEKHYIATDRARAQILGALEAGADIDKITIKISNPEYDPSKKDSPKYITKKPADFFQSTELNNLLKRKTEHSKTIRAQIIALRKPETPEAQATLEKIQAEKKAAEEAAKKKDKSEATDNSTPSTSSPSSNPAP